jgi:putative Mg2+ transporter-C (MgtC) family protein
VPPTFDHAPLLSEIALLLASAAQPDWGQLPGAVGGIVAALRLDLLTKLLLAVLLGGAIGFERELNGKPAGLRTNILICVGSCLLMDLSMSEGVIIDPAGRGVGAPMQLAANVVTGIGFLGAGTIMQARGAVVGLTTAATLWVVAAIGLTVGSGHYYEGTGAALLVMLVLSGLGTLERKMLRARRVVSGTVRTVRNTPFEELETVLRSAGIRVQSKQIFDHPDDRTFELKLVGPARQYDVVTAALMRRSDVLSVQFD